MTDHPFVPWPDGEVLVLASRSPRRAELLATVGLPFEIVTPADLEPPPGQTPPAAAAAPARYAEALAAAKAADVSDRRPGRLVLGADTIVLIDGAVLEKPRDAADAAGMLARLAGRAHVVITAIALADGRRAPWVGHERTTVRFLPLETAAIARYVATGEPLDKAGAYGIQGYGAMMVGGVDGCYFNVMGLPLALLGRALREVLSGRKEPA